MQKIDGRMHPTEKVKAKQMSRCQSTGASGMEGGGKPLPKVLAGDLLQEPVSG